MLKAVESTLRGASVLDDPQGRVCGVQPDGRPPTGCGQWFYAVHWGGGSGGDLNPQSINVAHAIVVTITARMGYAPRDRTGERLTLDQELLDRACALSESGVIHGSFTLLTAANRLIPGTAEYAATHGGVASTNGFVEPLVLTGYGPVVEQGPEWVGAETGDGCLVCECRFGEGRRVQVLY